MDEKLEVLHKEIDLIESVISRMAQNSFLIKGWTITLVVGLLTFFTREKDFPLYIIILICFIILFFCVLDGYYLKLEWKYRNLYSEVIDKRVNENDFSNLYNLEAKDTSKSGKKFKKKSLFIFYGPILLFIFVYSVIHNINIFDSSESNQKVESHQAEISIPDYDKMFGNLETELKEINENIVSLRDEVTDSKSEIKQFKDEISGMQGRISDLQEDADKLKNQINVLESSQNVNSEQR